MTADLKPCYLSEPEYRSMRDALDQVQRLGRLDPEQARQAAARAWDDLFALVRRVVPAEDWELDNARVAVEATILNWAEAEHEKYVADMESSLERLGPLVEAARAYREAKAAYDASPMSHEPAYDAGEDLRLEDEWHVAERRLLEAAAALDEEGGE